MNEKPKNPWVHFQGEYVKKFYDIKTIDGTEHKYCWPNAGVFHCKNGMTISGSAVGMVKICDDQWGEDLQKQK
jgi:hypothetical protein